MAWETAGKKVDTTLTEAGHELEGDLKKLGDKIEEIDR